MKKCFVIIAILCYVLKVSAQKDTITILATDTIAISDVIKEDRLIYVRIVDSSDLKLGEGFYFKRKKYGVWKYFMKQELSFSINYLSDTISLVKQFYNGKLYWSGKLKDNKRDGIWIKYDNRKKIRFLYKDGIIINVK